MAHEMKPGGPARTTTFVPGPALEPAGALLSWLQKEGAVGGKRRRLRLPVVFRFGDEYRLEVGDAWIGAADGPAGPDAVHLALDDGGMGIALLTQLDQRCAKPAPGCVFWMEGYWGALVDLPDLGFDAPAEGEPKHWPFAVLEVQGPVEADARPQIEAP